MPVGLNLFQYSKYHRKFNTKYLPYTIHILLFPPVFSGKMIPIRFCSAVLLSLLLLRLCFKLVKDLLHQDCLRINDDGYQDHTP